MHHSLTEWNKIFRTEQLSYFQLMNVNLNLFEKKKNCQSQKKTKNISTDQF